MNVNLKFVIYQERHLHRELNKISVYLQDIEQIIWDSTQYEVCSVLANRSEQLQKKIKTSGYFLIIKPTRCSSFSNLFLE